MWSGDSGPTPGSSNGTGPQSGVNGLMDTSGGPPNNSVNTGGANQQLTHLLQNKAPNMGGPASHQQHNNMSPNLINNANSNNKIPVGHSLPPPPNMSKGNQVQGISLNDMSNMNNIGGPNMNPMVTSMGPMTSSAGMSGGHMANSLPSMSNTLTSMSNMSSMAGPMSAMNKGQQGLVTSMAPGNMPDGVLSNGPLSGMGPQGMVGMRGPSPQPQMVGPMGPRHPGMPGQLTNRVQVRVQI